MKERKKEEKEKKKKKKKKERKKEKHISAPAGDVLVRNKVGPYARRSNCLLSRLYLPNGDDTEKRSVAWST